MPELSGPIPAGALRGLGARLRRRAPPILLLAVAVAWWAGFRQVPCPEAVLQHADGLALVARQHPVLAPLALLAAYAAMVALLVPGGTLLTILAGYLFGVWLGTALAVLAATLGASLIHTLARTPPGAALTQRLLGRLGGRAAGALPRLGAALRRDAFPCVLALRLAPFVPFWLVTLGAAVLGVPYRPFAAATLLGIVPATAVFATIGAGLDGALAAGEAHRRACLLAGAADCPLRLDAVHLVSPAILAGLAGLAALSLLPVVLRRAVRDRGLSAPVLRPILAALRSLG